MRNSKNKIQHIGKLIKIRPFTLSKMRFHKAFSIKIFNKLSTLFIKKEMSKWEKSSLIKFRREGKAKKMKILISNRLLSNNKVIRIEKRLLKEIVAEKLSEEFFFYVLESCLFSTISQLNRNLETKMEKKSA